jgi:uncharacterized protein YndB with AHSA1/START domain
MSQVQKNSRVEVIVDAPVEDVWRVVADVTRTGEWSHECRTVSWVPGAGSSAPGARFRGRNRAGWARWTRTCEIVAVDAPRELVWRTVPSVLFPDSTEWRIRLEPTGRGTAITQSFRVLRAPWLLDRLYARLIPSHQDRDARLAEDLGRIGAVARQGART